MGNNELKHWGIKGMKWGIRKYQNEDGTLTPAGKKRYANAKRGYDPDMHAEHHNLYYKYRHAKGSEKRALKKELREFNETAVNALNDNLELNGGRRLSKKKAFDEVTTFVGGGAKRAKEFGPDYAYAAEMKNAFDPDRGVKNAVKIGSKIAASLMVGGLGTMAANKLYRSGSIDKKTGTLIVDGSLIVASLLAGSAAKQVVSTIHNERNIRAYNRDIDKYMD